MRGPSALRSSRVVTEEVRGASTLFIRNPLFVSQLCVYLTQAKLKPRKIASRSSILTGTLRKWGSAVWIRSFLIFSGEHLLLGYSLQRSWSRWVSFWPKAGDTREAHSWRGALLGSSELSSQIHTSVSNFNFLKKKKKTQKLKFHEKLSEIFTVLGEIIEIMLTVAPFYLVSLQCFVWVVLEMVSFWSPTVGPTYPANCHSPSLWTSCRCWLLLRVAMPYGPHQHFLTSSKWILGKVFNEISLLPRDKCRRHTGVSMPHVEKSALSPFVTFSWRFI